MSRSVSLVATLNKLLLQFIPLLLLTLILQLLTDIMILTLAGFTIGFSIEFDWECVDIFKEYILFHFALFLCHLFELTDFISSSIRHCPV